MIEVGAKVDVRWLDGWYVAQMAVPQKAIGGELWEPGCSIP